MLAVLPASPPVAHRERERGWPNATQQCTLLSLWSACQRTLHVYEYVRVRAHVRLFRCVCPHVSAHGYVYVNTHVFSMAMRANLSPMHTAGGTLAGASEFAGSGEDSCADADGAALSVAAAAAAQQQNKKRDTRERREYMRQ